MKKTVKLEDHVYDSLHAFRDKDETFSDAIERLLSARVNTCQLLDVLEGQIKFREWQREKLLKLIENKRGED